MESKRDNDIDLLRWISILAVVVHHGISQTRHSQETIHAAKAVQSFLGWCVPAFLSISGAISGTGRSTRELLANRARRLMVPFVGVSFLSCAAMACASRMAHVNFGPPSELQWGAFVRKIVFLSGFGPQLYFLPYLFLATLLCHLLLKKMREGIVVLVLSGGLAVQCIAWISPRVLLGPGLHRLVPYVLCFAIGRWLYGVLRSGGDRAASRPLAIASMVAVASACLLRERWPLDIVVPFWLYAILRMLRLGDRIPPRLLRLNSGAVFLWHAPIILMGSSMVLDEAGVHDGWNFVAGCILCIPVSLAWDRVVARIPGGRFLRL